MKRAGQDTFVSRPRLDGSRVMFEFDDRGQRIPSAISRGALEELTGLRHLNAAELLRCFAEARDHIETIALGQIESQVGKRVWSAEHLGRRLVRLAAKQRACCCSSG